MLPWSRWCVSCALCVSCVWFWAPALTLFLKQPNSWWECGNKCSQSKYLWFPLTLRVHQEKSSSLTALWAFSLHGNEGGRLIRSHFPVSPSSGLLWHVTDFYYSDFTFLRSRDSGGRGGWTGVQAEREVWSMRSLLVCENIQEASNFSLRAIVKVFVSLINSDSRISFVDVETQMSLCCF